MPEHRADGAAYEAYRCGANESKDSPQGRYFIEMTMLFGQGVVELPEYALFHIQRYPMVTERLRKQSN